jgi:hypothetical protein
VPDRADVTALGNAALRWVAEQRERFDPDDLAGSSDKALVELAVMVRRHRAVPGGGDGADDLAAITGFVRGVLARPRYRKRRYRGRADVLGPAFLLAAVDPGSPLREELQRAVDAGVLDAHERPPHRVMEERLALDWAGLRHDLPAWEQLVAGSLPAAEPNAVFLGEAAAYQLTHVVLYLTAFGSRAPACAVGDAAGHRDLLTALLVRFTARAHWDLVAELLVSWMALGLGPSGVCDAAWQRLLDEVAPDGSLHAVGDGQGPDPGSQQWFYTRYHTTLVAIIAAETWLQADGAEPVPANPRRRPAGTRRERVAGLAREVADAEARRLAALLADDDALHPRTACTAVAGVWICGALSPTAAAALPGVARAAAAALGGAHEWTALPAALTFVACGVLRRHATVPDSLDRHVAAAAHALASTPASDGDLSLHEARFLLHRLGLLPAPPAAPATALEHAARAAAAVPDEANAAQLALAAEARSGHGAAAPSGAPGWIGELLLGLAVRQARGGDPIGAGRSTRAAVHLRGSGADMAHDLAAALAVPERSADQSGRLAASLNRVWTLAEVTAGWRLTAAL